ncbi:DNA damage-inducible transcript 4 protein-like [Eucyclogobius newberryi]|uniref:DNA damage-inducible transcript 4 protein-like n=1 Tax=Eucyclogobius newberryi TaxID=166745 RepID=UPI003B5CFDEF
MSFSINQSLDGSFPPSPAEDRGLNRLSWGSLLQRLVELKGNQREQQCNWSESGSVADLSLSDCDSSDCFSPLEESLASEAVATITQSLSEASHMLGCSKLIVPDCLVHNISQELVHLALSEPCGLRGALIDLCVDRGDQSSLCSVDQIAVDAYVVPTFQVTLVLRQESGGLWPKVQKLLKGRQSPQTPTKHQPTLRLSRSFRAIKKKLYCSGELLIEECC